MKQLTPIQARAFGEGGVWKEWSAKTLAAFQLNQDCLCVPFDEFHKAIEEALGRPVFTHELGLNLDGLRLELDGKAAPPSFEEVLALLPPDKTIVVIT